ncbi:uncharacterized protein [Hoplias malabaricus]|uniref:uncharacterized protein n=1 Tax=Hoplias malabaricus TaxID=27720 RepID=UPI0034634513
MDMAKLSDKRRCLAENGDLRPTLRSSSCEKTSSRSEMRSLKKSQKTTKPFSRRVSTRRSGITSLTSASSQHPTAKNETKQCPRHNLVPEILHRQSVKSNAENVSNDERELSAFSNDLELKNEPEKQTYTCSLEAEEPSVSPAAAPQRKSVEEVKVNSKSTSLSCVKVSQSKGASSETEVSSVKLPVVNKRFCIYCKESVIKMARHLGRVHADEKDVANALSFPKCSKIRRILFGLILKKGCYQQQTEAAQNGKGEIVQQNHTKDTPLNEYESCAYCQDSLPSRKLKYHIKICKSKPSSSLSDCLSERCRKIVNNMQIDYVSNYLRNDTLICKFGSELCEKKQKDWKARFDYVSIRMRRLSKLMLAVKELDPSIENLHQLCTESRFNLALEAAKKLCSFDQRSNKFKNLGKANNLRLILQQATKIALREDAVENKCTALARRFIILLNTEWVACMTSQFGRSPSLTKLNKEDVKAIMKDVVKLQEFLSLTERQATEELVKDPNPKTWEKLRNNILASVTLFNRGRRVIAEEILLENYLKRPKNSFSADEYETLTNLEQCLHEKLIQIDCTCKDGNTVSALLTGRMKSSLDLLNKYRKHVGVTEGNPYVFALLKGPSNMMAHNCIEDLALKCGVKNPESLNSPQAQKCVPLVFQILSLDDHEMQHVAELLCDNRFNCQKLRQNPSDLVEVVKVLHKMDQRTKPQEENCHETGRIKWAVKEHKAVMRQMRNIISRGKSPTKKDCMKCLRKEPDALQSRTWTQIKCYTQNIIAARKSKPRQKKADNDEGGHGEDHDEPRPKKRRLK